jgi:steroid 5-alpha reductase family enzyme
VTGSPTLWTAVSPADRRRGLLAVSGAYAVALAVAVAVGWALRGRSPVLVAALADIAATLVVFAFSVRHDNSSVYDPYWSVAPICIAAYWAAAGEVDLRALLVLLLVTTWGIRLTSNWVTRWRGLQDEDFRYVEIRRKAGRLYWPASLFGIHLLPTAWVFLGMLPTWPALSGQGGHLGALDLAALGVTTAGIVVKAVADRQLRRFLRTRRDTSAVVETGLWRLSRHPNYFGEVSFWWGLGLFGLAADPRWAWTVVGPLSITVLFLAVSIPWMDRRMRARHPAWAEKTASLPALVPWPWRRAGRRLAMVVAVLGGLGTAASHAAPPVEELRRRWAGEYLFVGGAAERAAVPAAVERSVDGMFFIARGIAYDRLLKNCDVCARYTLGFSGGNVSVSGPCQVPDVSADDGRELDHRNKLGETSKLSQRFVDETLVQEFRGDGGTRKVVWTLLPDGDTLRIHFTITSGHLPRPVDYSLTYRRKGAAPSPPDAGSSDARKPPPG